MLVLSGTKVTVPQMFLSSNATTLAPGWRSIQFWNLDEVNFVEIIINGMLTGTTKESKSVLVSYLEKVDNDGIDL